MKRITWIWAACVLAPQAQTVLPTRLAADAELTAAGNPYLLNDMLLIPEGVTLVIQAGVRVIVLSLGGIAEIGIHNQGRLEIRGTREAPVTFIPQDSASVKSSWFGIRNDSTSISTFTDMRLVGASIGFLNNMASSSITRCTLERCGIGVGVFGKERPPAGSPPIRLMVRESRISNCGTGIAAEDSAFLHVENSMVVGNTSAGLRLDGRVHAFLLNNVLSRNRVAVQSNNAAQVTLVRNTIARNQRGLNLRDFVVPILYNNVIAENKDGNFRFDASLKTILSHNLVFPLDTNFSDTGAIITGSTISGDKPESLWVFRPVPQSPVPVDKHGNFSVQPVFIDTVSLRLADAPWRNTGAQAIRFLGEAYTWNIPIHIEVFPGGVDLCRPTIGADPGEVDCTVSIRESTGGRVFRRSPNPGPVNPAGEFGIDLLGRSLFRTP